MNLLIGSILNYLVSLGMLFFGIIYLTKSSFMPYHSQALSMEWDKIERNSQLLILALMRTVSGGFLICAMATAFLQTIFIFSGTTWIPLLILIIGIISYSTSFYGQIIVRKNTPGNPPTAMSIMALVSLIAAYFFNYISTQ